MVTKAAADGSYTQTTSVLSWPSFQQFHVGTVENAQGQSVQFFCSHTHEHNSNSVKLPVYVII